ncbi:hypothetical protein ANN_15910 [Periplaneta americana]|uniref:Uncharacterized protein n=1 Tax=Periplaneta americana TaxID=6978 RepID=A0ABQ8SHI8_PERAM|nr:hypothetical protein ANN_15910 [Periplaneta americana]
MERLYRCDSISRASFVQKWVVPREGAKAHFRAQESLSALQRKGKRQTKEVLYRKIEGELGGKFKRIMKSRLSEICPEDDVIQMTSIPPQSFLTSLAFQTYSATQHFQRNCNNFVAYSRLEFLNISLSDERQAAEENNTLQADICVPKRTADRAVSSGTSVTSCECISRVVLQTGAAERTGTHGNRYNSVTISPLDYDFISVSLITFREMRRRLVQETYGYNPGDTADLSVVCRTAVPKVCSAEPLGLRKNPLLSHQSSTSAQSKEDNNHCNLTFEEDSANSLGLSSEYATHDPASEFTIPSVELRHHFDTHPDFTNETADYVKRKCDELHAVQTKILSRVKTNNYKALETSYLVSHDLGLTGKPHTFAGILIKQLLVKAVKCMVDERIAKLISSVPLSNNTVHNGIQDISNNVKNIIISCIKETQFLLQLDESTDVAGLAVLMTFVQYEFSDSFHEDILFCKPLPSSTMGSEFFSPDRCLH